MQPNAWLIENAKYAGQMGADRWQVALLGFAARKRDGRRLRLRYSRPTSVRKRSRLTISSSTLSDDAPVAELELAQN
jgi:hypothetical protein